MYCTSNAGCNQICKTRSRTRPAPLLPNGAVKRGEIDEIDEINEIDEIKEIDYLYDMWRSYLSLARSFSAAAHRVGTRAWPIGTFFRKAIRTDGNVVARVCVYCQALDKMEVVSDVNHYSYLRQ